MASPSYERHGLRIASMIIVSAVLVLTIQILIEPAIPLHNEKYESSVRTLFDQVLQDVSEMRQLPAPKATELQVVSIQFFQSEEERKVEEESGEISLEDIVYRALFLIPQNYSVGEARVEQAGRVLSAVAGTRLYVVKEYFDPEDVRAARRTLAHEITHILQHRFRPPPITTFDQRQAWIALVEGDADFTADTYIAASGPFSLAYARVPDSLDRIKGFPYRFGSGFIETLYQTGGWSLVNSAYEKTPSSTEEVLHPDVYLAGGSSAEVLALLPSSEGWSVSWTETVGEYFIRIMLENGVSGDIAETAAVGWGGDNLTLFSRSEVYLVTWRIGWDTAADATEFYEAYQLMLKDLGGEEAAPGLYRLLGHYVTVALDGRVTEIVSGADRGSVESLRAQLAS